MLKNIKFILLLSATVFAINNYSADLKMEVEMNTDKQKEIDHFAPDREFPVSKQLREIQHLKCLRFFLNRLVNVIDFGKFEVDDIQYVEDYDFIKDLKNFLSRDEIDALIKLGKEYVSKKVDLEDKIDKYANEPKFYAYYSEMEELAKTWYKNCHKLIELYNILIKQAKIKFTRFDEYLEKHKDLIKLNLPYSS